MLTQGQTMNTPLLTHVYLGTKKHLEIYAVLVKLIKIGVVLFPIVKCVLKQVPNGIIFIPVQHQTCMKGTQLCVEIIIYFDMSIDFNYNCKLTL